jgi:hypothetical protein
VNHVAIIMRCAWCWYGGGRTRAAELRRPTDPYVGASVMHGRRPGYWREDRIVGCASRRIFSYGPDCRTSAILIKDGASRLATSCQLMRSASSSTTGFPPMQGPIVSRVTRLVAISTLRGTSYGPTRLRCAGFSNRGQDLVHQDVPRQERNHRQRKLVGASLAQGRVDLKDHCLAVIVIERSNQNPGHFSGEPNPCGNVPMVHA